MRARWNVRANAVVLAWLLAAAVVAIAHRSIPQAPWLMVHLLLLGGASSAILIWSAHFAEGVRRRPLPGGRPHLAARLVLHNLGAVAVITGLLTGARPALVGGAVAVSTSALWHAWCLWRQGRDQVLASPLGWTARFFVAATLALPVGAALGVLLADGQLAAPTHARVYVAHVVVMLLGWVGLTVVGASLTLWPTMLRTRIADHRLAARHGLPVLGTAVVVMLAGAASGWRLGTAAGLLLYLGGLLVTAGPLLREARARRPVGYAAWSVGAAWLWLAGTVLAQAVIVAGAEWPAAADRLGGTIAPLAVGFAAQVLLGALTHLGPVVLGGGPAVSRRLNHLVQAGAGARVVVLNGGLLLFLLPAPSWVRVVVSVVVLAAMLVTPVLLIRAALIARRARATGRPPAEPRRPARRHGRSAMAGLATLALAVTAGVALDPAALGVGTSAAGGVTPTGRTSTVEVTAVGMRFEPSVIEVNPGDALVIVLTNDGDQVHDLVLGSGARSGRLAPGETETIDVGVVGRDLAGWCSVAGHRQMGMTLDIRLADTPGEPSASAESPSSDLQPFDARLEPAPDTDVHRSTLTAQEVDREVAPGVHQRLWTFDGTVPGPVLRGRVGDTFEITLVNDGSIGHSIDFHAGAMAPDEPMRTIAPGESLTFELTATRAGIWMYHCSTAPMSLHIANGMFGAVIIDPPDLPAVDHEYLLVQSELYLGEQGQPADMAKIQAEAVDAMAFNGYAAQYEHLPLPARAGDHVRLWVLDAGPNRPTAFHVVGGQFDTVFAEGAYLLDGGPSQHTGAQVLALLPGQGGFVELVPPEPGHYPFVSHIMVDAERGARGVLEVSSARPSPPAGH